IGELQDGFGGPLPLRSCLSRHCNGLLQAVARASTTPTSPDHLRVYEDSSPIACQKPIARYYGRRSFTTCAVSSLFRPVSVGEGVPLPRPRLQVVHGTVPQKCARNTLPARSGILYRPAIEGLRCHPLPTS